MDNAVPPFVTGAIADDWNWTWLVMRDLLRTTGYSELENILFPEKDHRAFYLKHRQVHEVLVALTKKNPEEQSWWASWSKAYRNSSPLEVLRRPIARQHEIQWRARSI